MAVSDDDMKKAEAFAKMVGGVVIPCADEDDAKEIIAFATVMANTMSHIGDCEGCQQQLIDIAYDIFRRMDLAKAMLEKLGGREKDPKLTEPQLREAALLMAYMEATVFSMSAMESCEDCDDDCGCSTERFTVKDGGHVPYVNLSRPVMTPAEDLSDDAMEQMLKDMGVPDEKAN